MKIIATCPFETTRSSRWLIDANVPVHINLSRKAWKNYDSRQRPLYWPLYRDTDNIINGIESRWSGIRNAICKILF